MCMRECTYLVHETPRKIIFRDQHTTLPAVDPRIIDCFRERPAETQRRVAESLWVRQTRSITSLCHSTATPALHREGHALFLGKLGVLGTVLVLGRRREREQ